MTILLLLLESNALLFLGRFHPLVIHLPIGFIILSIIFEFISRRKKIDLYPAITYGLLAGAIFGAFSIALGLMLATDGGYNEDTLSIHKWSGISTTGLAFLAYFLKKNKLQNVRIKKIYHFNLGLLLLVLTITGHFGGNLTHGSNYLLEHAPQPLRSMAGLKPPRIRITKIDSALVYEDVIHHMFKSKCIVCHNGDKSKGDLILVNRESIIKGGENGSVIASGNPVESELFRRITLDADHDDFMPSEGRTALTKEETALLEWWILEGIPFDKKVISMDPPDEIVGYLKEVGIGEEKTFLELIDLPEISKVTYDSILDAGFKIKTIANNTSMLEISYSPYNREQLTEQKLNVLLVAKLNIAWLNLSGIYLSDSWLTIPGQLTNLTELRLNNTMITDEGIKHLTSLENLEYLNVYDTSITDDAVEYIVQLAGLKKLFLWQTSITQAGLESISNSLPDLIIVRGYSL